MESSIASEGFVHISVVAEQIQKMLADKTAAMADLEAKHKAVIERLKNDLADVRTSTAAEVQRLESAINATCRIILGKFPKARCRLLLFCIL